MKFFNLYPGEGATSQIRYSPALTKSLLSVICLRRPKNVIELPGRTDEIHKVEFEIDESQHYNEMNASISASLRLEFGQTHLRTYSSILTKINALRQICNLGTLYQRVETSFDHAPPVQEIFEGILSAGVASCYKCGRNLLQGDPINESLLGESEDSLQPRPRLAECGEVICASCSGQYQNANHPRCKHRPSCQFFEVKNPSSGAIDTRSSSFRLPTKIRALQNDIRAVPTNQKRLVALTHL